jgi:hypothetical protein
MAIREGRCKRREARHKATLEAFRTACSDAFVSSAFEARSYGVRWARPSTWEDAFDRNIQFFVSLSSAPCIRRATPDCDLLRRSRNL